MRIVIEGPAHIVLMELRTLCVALARRLEKVTQDTPQSTEDSNDGEG